MSGELDMATFASAYSNPNYLVLSALSGTLLNLFWSIVQASLYVELRDWKDGPGTQNLEQIFA